MVLFAVEELKYTYNSNNYLGNIFFDLKNAYKDIFDFELLSINNYTGKIKYMYLYSEFPTLAIKNIVNGKKHGKCLCFCIKNKLITLEYIQNYLVNELNGRKFMFVFDSQLEFRNSTNYVNSKCNGREFQFNCYEKGCTIYNWVKGDLHGYEIILGPYGIIRVDKYLNSSCVGQIYAIFRGINYNLNHRKI